MPPVLARSPSSLKRQDSRSQLIAAGNKREQMERAKTLSKILTNDDTQAMAAAKLMKTRSSRIGPGMNEASQKEAGLVQTEIDHAKYREEKKPTKVGKLVAKLEKKLKKPLKLLAKLRKALRTLTEKRAFFGLIIGTVLLSCVVLALNAPYALYI